MNSTASGVHHLAILPSNQASISSALRSCPSGPRTKDVIKSGGEWISSIEVENVATDHPKVAEAAVIGHYHPKWSERPLLIVVRGTSGQDLTAEEMLAWFDGRIAKWWTPEAVEFIDELPHTATGKIQKVTLREMYKDYAFPE